MDLAGGVEESLLRMVIRRRANAVRLRSLDDVVAETEEACTKLCLSLRCCCLLTNKV